MITTKNQLLIPATGWTKSVLTLSKYFHTNVWLMCKSLGRSDHSFPLNVSIAFSFAGRHFILLTYLMITICCSRYCNICLADINTMVLSRRWAFSWIVIEVVSTMKCFLWGNLNIQPKPKTNQVSVKNIGAKPVGAIAFLALQSVQTYIQRNFLWLLSNWRRKAMLTT